MKRLRKALTNKKRTSDKYSRSVPTNKALSLNVKLTCLNKSVSTLSEPQSRLGTNYLEFDWFVPEKGLQYQRG